MYTQTPFIILRERKYHVRHWTRAMQLALPPSMRLTFTRRPKMQKESLRYFPIALFSRDASIAARMHRQISPGTASTKQYSTTGQTPIGVPR